MSQWERERKIEARGERGEGGKERVGKRETVGHRTRGHKQNERY